MKKVEIINFSVAEGFKPVYDEFMLLIETDKEFIDSVKKMAPRFSKKNKHNKQRSAKIRFAIAYYLRAKKKENQSETDNTH